MPLNKKGKKILASMEKRYGTKKGKTVFYAMENSGKLKGIKASKGLMVKKYAGGGMDASKSDFNTPAASPGDTGGEGGWNTRDNSTNQIGNRNSSPTSTGTPTALSFSQTKSANNVSTGNSFMPISMQLIGNIANSLTKGYRTTKAKGENILSKQVTLPSTRDYYRTTGKQLDVMSPEGKQYLQDDNQIPNPNPPVPTGIGKENNTGLCPDGTNPPCKTPLTQIKNPISTPNPFLSGFRAYDDGGEVVISSNVDKSLL